MDIIFISEHKFETLIGIYEWERKVPQTIQLDLEIGVPGGRVVATDEIGDTIDYGAVTRRIEESLGQQHFLLLERMAEHVASLVIDEFRAPWVRVTIAKLAIIRGVKKVGIRLERGQKN
ncbi:MAG: dihydroneopterin aldolase [Burkholderiales bacterium]|nr:dihydroneopterin aldolase [Burkholderiales bacterium]